MPTDRPADLVLRGGRIATVDAARRSVSALAVTDGRIVAVGTDAVVEPHIGPSTRVIELRGRSVDAGFRTPTSTPSTAGSRCCAATSTRTR